jgi:hypothetical protein
VIKQRELPEVAETLMRIVNKEEQESQLGQAEPTVQRVAIPDDA